LRLFLHTRLQCRGFSLRGRFIRNTDRPECQLLQVSVKKSDSLCQCRSFPGYQGKFIRMEQRLSTIKISTVLVLSRFYVTKGGVFRYKCAILPWVVSKKIDTVVPMPTISNLKRALYGWNRDFLHVYLTEWHCPCPIKILRYKESFLSDEQCHTQVCQNKLTQLRQCRRFPILRELCTDETETFYMCII